MRNFINIIAEAQGELFPDYHIKHRNAMFDKWFADSVAATDGRPTVFYHATDKDFEEFNAVNVGTASVLGMSGSVERHGAFFAVDPKFAEEYIAGKPNGRVMPVNLSIQKPFDLRDDAINHLLNSLYSGDELAISLKDKGVDLYGIANHIRETDRWQLFDDTEGEDFVEALKALGFDGAVMNEAGDDVDSGEVWVAFYPSQIKSVYNRGSYSPNSGKISEDAHGQRSEDCKRFLLKKYQERAMENRRPIPTDLTGACKFAALFAQKLHGGDIAAHPFHTWLVVNGQVIDYCEDAADVQSMKNGRVHSSAEFYAEENGLSLDFDPSELYEDDEYFRDEIDFQEALDSCRPRVEQWFDDWMGQ